MKRIFTIIMVVLAIFIVSLDIFAVTDPGYNAGLVNNNITTTAKDVWATVVVIIQIVSVACIVFAGLRYMFASANQKADIKQGMIFLGIGGALVFGATLIIDLVAGAAENIM